MRSFAGQIACLGSQVLRSPLLRKWPLSRSFFKGAQLPLSSAPVWAEPSQLLIGMWLLKPRRVKFPHSDNPVSQDVPETQDHSAKMTVPPAESVFGLGP